jgi:hypothetical protein
MCSDLGSNNPVCGVDGVRSHLGRNGVAMTTEQQAVVTPTPVYRNGFGLAGIILGIVGLLFALVPLTFWVAGLIGGTGLILALVGRARAKRGEASNAKTAWAGISSACWRSVARSGARRSCSARSKSSTSR